MQQRELSKHTALWCAHAESTERGCPNEADKLAALARRGTATHFLARDRPQRQGAIQDRDPSEGQTRTTFTALAPSVSAKYWSTAQPATYRRKGPIKPIVADF